MKHIVAPRRGRKHRRGTLDAILASIRLFMLQAKPLDTARAARDIAWTSAAGTLYA